MIHGFFFIYCDSGWLMVMGMFPVSNIHKSHYLPTTAPEDVM